MHTTRTAESNTPLLFIVAALTMAIAVFAFPSGAHAACVQLQTYPPQTVCSEPGGTSGSGTVSTTDSNAGVVGGNPATPSAATSNLVAFWKFDETSGTATIDSSSNGNTGTLENGATRYVGTRQGNKLLLDGVDDRVSVSTVSANVSNMTSVTVTGWIRPAANGGIIVRKGNTDTARFNFGVNATGNLYFRAGYSGQSGAWNSIATIPLNTWSHVAVAYTFGAANDPVFFIGGVQVGGTEVTAPSGDAITDTPYLYIGNNHNLANNAVGDGTSGFEGRMDNVRVYNAALSANAIASIRMPEPDASDYSPVPFPSIPALTNASENSVISGLQAQLNALVAQIAALQGGNASSGGPTNAAAMASVNACPAITHALSRGSRGDDVVGLQRALIARGVLAAGNDTGFFGPLTEAAVQAFQRGASIASSGTPEGNGYGVFGPRTRAAFRLNCQ